jgi:tRNA threonylcarbamoyladenosine biosynthesis protein TsaE
MSDTTVHIQTLSPDETEEVGRILAPFVELGAVIALYGNLAAGKTCLVHGFAAAFHVKERVNSPTFTIINEYHGDQTLFHLDLYRLTTAAEIYDLGYEEIFDNEEGICLVEWAERADDLLPKDHIAIRLEHINESARGITIDAHTNVKPGWQDALRKRFSAQS